MSDTLKALYMAGRVVEKRILSEKERAAVEQSIMAKDKDLIDKSAKLANDWSLSVPSDELNSVPAKLGYVPPDIIRVGVASKEEPTSPSRIIVVPAYTPSSLHDERLEFQAEARRRIDECYQLIRFKDPKDGMIAEVGLFLRGMEDCKKDLGQTFYDSARNFMMSAMLNIGYYAMKANELHRIRADDPYFNIRRDIPLWNSPPDLVLHEMEQMPGNHHIRVIRDRDKRRRANLITIDFDDRAKAILMNRICQLYQFDIKESGTDSHVYTTSLYDAAVLWFCCEMYRKKVVAQCNETYRETAVTRGSNA